MTSLATRLSATLIALGIAAPVLWQPALAQRGPFDRPNSQYQRPTGPGYTGGVPGRFDYYTLALSWSPTYCAGLERGGYDPQCHRRDGRRYAFVLHGLWPQYERGFPEFCPTPDRPFVPQGDIDRMQDIMPSPKLTIHQWRKHGVCSGLSTQAYFDLSRRIYGRIKIPQRFVNPPSPQFVDTGEVLAEFIAANPGLRPDMIAVACGGPGDRLREVRICFSREGEPRTCGANESQRRLCAAPRVFVPPVREGAALPDTGRVSPRGRTPGEMLPGPVPPVPGQRAL